MVHRPPSRPQPTRKQWCAHRSSRPQPTCKQWSADRSSRPQPICEVSPKTTTKKIFFFLKLVKNNKNKKQNQTFSITFRFLCGRREKSTGHGSETTVASLVPLKGVGTSWTGYVDNLSKVNVLCHGCSVEFRRDWRGCLYISFALLECSPIVGRLSIIATGTSDARQRGAQVGAPAVVASEAGRQQTACRRLSPP